MIYLDNAATSTMYEACLEDYRTYGCESFYNPSALYGAALGCANVVKQARETIANTLAVRGEEIVFTASGSESDNIAMLCSIRPKRGKIVVGSTEHSAVYQCAQELSARGYEVIYAPCDQYGRTEIRSLEALLDEDVVLVSIMHVCNETGALNDLAAITAAVREKAPYALIHSDGVQAYGKINVSLPSLGVDLYSISAHKIHGPKGIGALYCRSGLYLKPFVLGGGQENNVRSATENVASIAAFARAARIAVDGLNENALKLRALQTRALEKLNDIAEIRIDTDPDHSAPHIVRFAVPHIRGEVAVHCLEQEGILVGTGSACSSRKSGQRIPRALGYGNTPYAEGILRISFSENNTIEDVEIFARTLKSVIAQLERYQRV